MGYRLPKRASGKPNVAFILKACPRCLGDLAIQHDLSGDYYVCLYCGAQIEWPPQERGHLSPAVPRHARVATTTGR